MPRWRLVGFNPNRARSSKLRTPRFSAHFSTTFTRLLCSDLPRVTIAPTLIAPSLRSLWKFSRSRSKKGSLLFYSISKAMAPLSDVRTWSISYDIAARSTPSTNFLISILRLRQPRPSREFRRRCVEFASPPPPRINSKSWILISISASHNSPNGSGKPYVITASALFTACMSNPAS